MHPLDRRSRRAITLASTVVFFFTGGVPTDAQPSEAASTLDPADFTTEVTNPFFPLLPGTRWVYEGPDDAGDLEHREVVVTPDTRQVMGVTCVVVHDVVRMGGEITEDTYDWYAQHKDGSVWYFGEDTKDIEGGKVKSTDGSWEAGTDGAQPGIIMQADPQVGQAYRNEYQQGTAEDQAEVLSLTETVTVPSDTYEGVLMTKNWSELDPGVVEHKYYARDVGTIKEEHVQGEPGRHELMEMTRGSAAGVTPGGEDGDGDDEGPDDD